MRIKQVRNATLRLDFGGVKFLVDPYLAKKDAYPGFEGTVNSHIRNPRLPLRTPMEDILGVDAVIVPTPTRTTGTRPRSSWCRRTCRCSPSMKRTRN